MRMLMVYFAVAMLAILFLSSAANAQCGLYGRPLNTRIIRTMPTYSQHVTPYQTYQVVPRVIYNAPLVRVYKYAPVRTFFNNRGLTCGALGCR